MPYLEKEDRKTDRKRLPSLFHEKKKKKTKPEHKIKEVYTIDDLPKIK
jgi:hypothetical protein